jgi:phosphatidylglycerophosphatase A
MLSAFILFRVFDILKPLGLRRLEALGGGPGIMADDVAAGILTNAVLQLWRLLI